MSACLQLHLRRRGRASAAVNPSRSPIVSLPPSSSLSSGGALEGPLATLRLVLHQVELVPAPPKGYWVVIKCGPHWAKTNIRQSPDFAWELQIPIYHPTSTLIMVAYGELGRGRTAFLGKLQYRISYLMYLANREQLKSLKLRSDDKDDKGRRKVAGSVLIAFTCDIPDRQRLLKAYERSPYPPAVHLISLFHAASRDAILERHHSKVVDWLADADPPVPSHVAWKVLETGRERFKLVRARHNIQRLKEAVSWLPQIKDYHRDLKAWTRPLHNILSVFVMYAVCFYPRETLLVFVVVRSVFALKRLLRQGFVEYLGVELGDIFDTAGLLPADFFDEDDDDEDNYYDSNHHDHRHRHGRHHGHHHGEGGGSSMRDSAAVMMFQPKRLRALKRRYDQLQRIALQVTHQSTKGMLPLLC
eukprot:jgi/Chrzof1/9180/Cz03g38270.t1